jgi:O-6-methylguanine DNA methyltransferase
MEKGQRAGILQGVDMIATNETREISVGIVNSSLIGPLRVATTDSGLCAVAFADWSDGLLLKRWEERGWKAVKRAHTMIAAFAEEVALYDAGKLRAFAIPLDLGSLPEFSQKVLRATHQIQFGESASYAEVAQRVGKPNAMRAVGQVMRRNPLPLVVPCHRVIASAQKIGGFTPGVALKQKLLRHEKCALTAPLRGTLGPPETKVKAQEFLKK